MRQRAPLVALAAILAGFLDISSNIAIRTPAWESSDEPGHVYNIEQLTGGHCYEIPAHPPHRISIHNERHQPPLYYLIMAGAQRLIGEPVHPVNPGPLALPFTSRGLFLHHSAAQHRFLLALRLPGLAFGLITILFTFLSARLLTGDRWTPVVAAAICGLLPRFLFLSAGVTNDNVVTAVGALLTYCALRCVPSASTIRAAVLGAVSGLVVFATFSALPALAVLVAVVAAQDGLRRRLRTTLIVTLVALLACGWYLTRNTVLYGSPFAVTATHRYLSAIFGFGTSSATYKVNHPLALILSQVPQRIFHSFWYQSGWNQFTWPTGTDIAYWVALATALAGLRRSMFPLRSRLWVLLTLTVAGFATVWITAFSTFSYEARLGFYGLPALACLAALGLERWRLPVRLMLPAIELVGAVIAIQQDVLAVHWY